MHSLCASCASFTRSADLAAYRVTSTRRLKLNKSFSRAGHVDVQRVVDGEVDPRRTSTSELACEAGTSGTLSAGNLSLALRAGTPALLMVCGRLVAARAADSETFVPLLLSHVRVFGSEVDGSTTLDERRRTMWLGAMGPRHGARRGRTAWTGEVQRAGPDTFRHLLSDPIAT